MSGPLIQDKLLIQEINRMFKMKYGEKNGENNEIIGEYYLEDPRNSEPTDAKLASFREQRERIRQL